MKTVGLIVEYNPLHNGHLYHIEKARSLTGATNVIVVMSGNYVQRGTPAMFPKHLRTAMALHCGASLVLELPVCYATASAEFFALGAVSLLDKLGCVDYICFGSECGEIKPLSKIATILNQEPQAYRDALQINLKLGISYPRARQLAINDYLEHKNEIISDVLEHPNNILGIEYLKALQVLNSKIIPVTIKRQGSNYHDQSLATSFSSASAIRNSIEHSDFKKSKTHLPPYCYDLLKDNFQLRYPVQIDDYSLLLHQCLLKETKISLQNYVDITEDIANRIINQSNNFLNITQFCKLLKTKDGTYSRISRSLLHIILNIKKDDFNKFLSNGIHFYIRVLGFQKKHASLLNAIKEYASLPILTKISANDSISSIGMVMLSQDIEVANLYEAVVSNKFKTPFINEQTQSLIILP